MTDIEIAQAAKPKDIYEIAKKLEIPLDYVVPYGKYKAKIDYHILSNIKRKPGKLILMTAINPTPAGEGKTTVTVGLADALNHLGKKCTVALREPSLGPVFGIKGGAAGGGRAQVIPMEDINLHFTGDFHAISSANNLLAAMLDAHIFHGNELGIDTNNITWKRAVDMNDRQLRHIRDGLGGNKNGIERNDGFDITVASEIMAIFCLSTDISDLKKNLSKIVVAYTKDNKPVTAHDLHAEGALTALLKDAINPNLVQSLEGTPAFIHGGPFANIAHGCNSVMATKMAMQLSDYTITEAGFGADLGAEKFFDIKCRLAEIKPDASVVVASCRALKNHGGVKNEDLAEENLTAIETGIQNLFQHVQNIQNEYCLPCLVAINVFSADSKAEIKLMEELCSKNGIETAITNVWEKGGNGGIDLAKKLVSICENGDTKGHSRKTFKYLYDSKLSIKEKIECIAKKIYHANGVNYIHNSEEEIQRLEKLGFGNMPVCIAKTQYSFSDDASKLGAPTNFNISIRNVKVNAGAGFIVALTGTILTLPGLGKKPAAFNIDVDNNGVISGLF